MQRVSIEGHQHNCDTAKRKIIALVNLSSVAKPQSQREVCAWVFMYTDNAGLYVHVYWERFQKKISLSSNFMIELVC